MTVYTSNQNCDCYTAYEEGCRWTTETFHLGKSCDNPEHLLCDSEGGIPQDVIFTPEEVRPPLWSLFEALEQIEGEGRRIASLYKEGWAGFKSCPNFGGECITIECKEGTFYVEEV